MNIRLLGPIDCKERYKKKKKRSEADNKAAVSQSFFVRHRDYIKYLNREANMQVIITLSIIILI